MEDEDDIGQWMSVIRARRIAELAKELEKAAQREEKVRITEYSLRITKFAECCITEAKSLED